jgi:hypothetical protein
MKQFTFEALKNPLFNLVKFVMLKLTVSVNLRLILGLIIYSDFFVTIMVVGLAYTTFCFLFVFSRTDVKSMSPHALAFLSSNSLKTISIGFVGSGSSFLSSEDWTVFSAIIFDVFS